MTKISPIEKNNADCVSRVKSLTPLLLHEMSFIYRVVFLLLTIMVLVGWHHIETHLHA